MVKHTKAGGSTSHTNGTTKNGSTKNGSSKTGSSGNGKAENPETKSSKKKSNSSNGTLFERISIALTKFTGSTPAFIIALSLILVWAITGPVFKYSETWQLIINTGTTIITFLMVFLIQRTQNKDSMAIQLKLNEIIASIYGASNKLVDIEDLSESELNTLKRHYEKLAKLFEQEKSIKESHSVEEAEKRHNTKLKKAK